MIRPGLWIYIDQLLLGAISCLVLLRPRLIGTDLESLRYMYLLILDRLTPWAYWYCNVWNRFAAAWIRVNRASLKARFRKHYYMYLLGRYIMFIAQVVIIMFIRNDP